MEMMKPFLVAKPFYRMGKHYQPGDIVLLGELEADKLTAQRMLGSQVRQTREIGGIETETGALTQPEKRSRLRGRPRKMG